MKKLKNIVLFAILTSALDYGLMAIVLKNVKCRPADMDVFYLHSR